MQSGYFLELFLQFKDRIANINSAAFSHHKNFWNLGIFIVSLKECMYVWSNISIKIVLVDFQSVLFYYLAN